MDKKSVSSDQLKQSPEDMIRALQGIFCKGRYYSWVATQGNSFSENSRFAKKHRKSTAKNKYGG